MFNQHFIHARTFTHIPPPLSFPKSFFKTQVDCVGQVTFTTCLVTSSSNLLKVYRTGLPVAKTTCILHEWWSHPRVFILHSNLLQVCALWKMPLVSSDCPSPGVHLFCLPPTFLKPILVRSMQWPTLWCGVPSFTSTDITLPLSWPSLFF